VARQVVEHTITNRSYFRAVFTAALGFYAARALGWLLMAAAVWSAVALWSLSRRPGGLEQWARLMVGW
jgi:hypothetical protein